MTQRRWCKNAKHEYKIRGCEVCGRDYRAAPEQTKGGAITYRGTCPYCGTTDYARGDGSTRGHLEIDWMLEDWQVDIEDAKSRAYR